jgi:hypothetical protein
MPTSRLLVRLIKNLEAIAPVVNLQDVNYTSAEKTSYIGGITLVLPPSDDSWPIEETCATIVPRRQFRDEDREEAPQSEEPF